MKAKVSIAMDAKTLESVKKLIDNRKFRNKSPLIECAVIKLIEEENKANLDSLTSNVEE